MWVSDAPNLVELEENLVQLEQKGSDLKQEDSEILSLIDDLAEIEKNAKASSEYQDKIILWKFRINKKLKEDKQNNKQETSLISYANNKSIEFSITVKLSTLKIEKDYGDITFFQNFWNSVKIALYYKEYLSNIEKMNYLLSYLGGNAYNAYLVLLYRAKIMLKP